MRPCLNRGRQARHNAAMQADDAISEPCLTALRADHVGKTLRRTAQARKQQRARTRHARREAVRANSRARRQALRTDREAGLGLVVAGRVEGRVAHRGAAALGRARAALRQSRRFAGAMAPADAKADRRADRLVERAGGAGLDRRQADALTPAVWSPPGARAIMANMAGFHDSVYLVYPRVVSARAESVRRPGWRWR